MLGKGPSGEGRGARGEGEGGSRRSISYSTSLTRARELLLTDFEAVPIPRGSAPSALSEEKMSVLASGRAEASLGQAGEAIGTWCRRRTARSASARHQRPRLSGKSSSSRRGDQSAPARAHQVFQKEQRRGKRVKCRSESSRGNNGGGGEGEAARGHSSMQSRSRARPALDTTSTSHGPRRGFARRPQPPTNGLLRC